MIISFNDLVTVTEANKNFSKVTRIVDNGGVAVITKNNKPKYIMIDSDKVGELNISLDSLVKGSKETE